MRLAAAAAGLKMEMVRLELVGLVLEETARLITPQTVPMLRQIPGLAVVARLEIKTTGYLAQAQLV